MRTLDQVTLLAVEGTAAGVAPTAQALAYSQRGIRFARTMLFAPFNPEPGSREFEFVENPYFKSNPDWGKWIVFELHRHVTTPYIMLVHADGFVVNPGAWEDEFLQYDYIGSPWPLPRDNFSYRDVYGNIIRVGNSVGLRSRRLLELPAQLGLEWTPDHGFYHEDGFLCVQNRHILQANGIKFAPLAVACRFAREHPIPENRSLEPFAFHKWIGPNRRYPRFTPRPSLATLARKAARKWFGRRSSAT